MKFCVYWLHLSHHNDYMTEGYIGVTNNPSRRFIEHKRSSTNNILESAFLTYGNDIIQTILFEGTESECYDFEKQHRPSEYIGWNIAEGGNKPPKSKSGWNHSIEAKQKISKSMLSKKTWVGRKHSDSSKRKMSELKIGVAKTQEHRKNISEALKGKGNPNFGKRMSDETKKKISEAVKAKMKNKIA